MTTMPNMKLPDILGQFRKKDPAAGSGTGKSYEPITPGRGEKPHDPVRPKGGGRRTWPFMVGIIIISLLFAVGEFIKDSEPFKLAAALVKENPSIREDLGEIKDIYPWFPSSFKSAGDTLRVRLTLRIDGKNGKGKAFFTLVYVRNSWQVTTAAYENRQGKLITLTTGDVREKPLPAPYAGSGKMSLGHNFYRKNDFQQAVTAYSQAIAEDPNNSAAYYWRGRAYYRLNLLQQAEADFKKTVALNSRHAEAYNWLGWLAERNGRYDECVVHLTKAVDLKADNAWGYYHRGRCNYQQGRRKEARQDAAQACRLGYEQACKVARQLP